MAKHLWVILTASLLIGYTQHSYAQISIDDHPTTSPAQKVYTQASNSIFTIFGVDPEGKDKSVALGSAVAIDKNILATNCHVALAGSFLFLEVDINGTRQRGQLYYYDQRNDLCLIKVPGTTFSPVKIRSSNLVNIGEEVFAIGNPEGFEKTISRGIISNELKFKNTVILQTDAAISPGSSGGGLFDVNGNLIGITFLKDVETGATNISFAIPTELITEALQQEQPLPPQQHPKQSSESTSIINSDQSETQKEVQPVTQSSVLQSEPKSISESKNYTTPNLTLLGHFGKSSVGLFRWDDDCFITLVGNDTQNIPQSLAIWFVDTPNFIFLFPNTIHIDDAIKILNAYLESKDKTLQESYSYIALDNKMYELYGDSHIKDKFPILMRKFEENPTTILMDGNYFVVQFKDFDSESGMKTIEYDLLGFSEALASARTFCIQPKKSSNAQ